MLSDLPFGNYFPGTELLQSPFRMEFSMGSLSRRYRGSLRRCRDWRATMPIVARLTKHRKSLLYIVKHHETLVRHCDTSWNIIKYSKPLIKHDETVKTLWNIMFYRGAKHYETLLRGSDDKKKNHLIFTWEKNVLNKTYVSCGSKHSLFWDFF